MPAQFGVGMELWLRGEHKRICHGERNIELHHDRDLRSGMGYLAEDALFGAVRRFVGVKMHLGRSGDGEQQKAKDYHTASGQPGAFRLSFQ